MPDSPELIPRFRYSKSWESPADYATHQNSEVQNRRDLQSLFTEIETYLNAVLLPRAEQLLTGGGGSGSGDVSGDYLPLSGGTMQGVLRLYRNPALNAEAATKEYVDSEAGRIRSNLTAISQRDDAIELVAQNQGADIAALSVRADQIESRIDDVDGNGSSIEQTAESILQRVSDAEGNLSDITQTVNGISLNVSTVTENGEVFARITLRIGENNLYGYIKLDGNVQVSGQLSAEALYAGYGEVANLAVDQLITSRRIVKYLSGDTSDDNFLRAFEQRLEWVTGSCNGGTVQACNPDGSPLYWPVDISGLSRGVDGYPVTGQGERVFTTTSPTAYPVYVYNYTEAIKRSISFESVNGIYSPVDRFGAGNQQGNNKAWILKTADGFDIRYLTPDNKEIGIRMSADGKVTIDGLELEANDVKDALGVGGGSDGSDGGDGLDLTDASGNGLSVGSDGYADITGLRRPDTIDFSGLDSGSFTEILEGGIVNTYAVGRDNAGRIATVTDATGHVTTVVWE